MKKPDHFKMKLLKFSVVAVLLPVIVMLLSLNIRSYQEPFYQAFSLDPSYAYLLNSLNIANGERPGHTDHPGTTVQLLGGAIIKLSSLTHSADLNQEVLGNPEKYIKIISNFFIAIVLFAIMIFGVTVYRLSNSLSLAIVAQALPLIYVPLLRHLPKPEPEPILVACAYILAALLLPYIVKEEKRPSVQLFGVLAIGFVLGVGVITKITFLPLLALVLIIPGIKDKMRVFSVFLITCVLLTFPIWDAFIGMLKWFTSLLIHSGQYGKGDVGIPESGKIMENGARLWKQIPGVFYLSLGLLLSAIAGLFSTKESRNFRPTIIASLFSITGGLIINLKHPSPSGHYMMPVLALSGFFFLIFFLTLPIRHGGGLMRFTFIPFFLLITFQIKNAYGLVVNGLIGYQKIHENFARTEQILSQNNCHKIEYYQSSSKEYALSFGNGYARHRYDDELSKMYPDFISYNIWGNWFTGFDGRIPYQKIEEEVKGGKRFCMIGTIKLPYEGQPDVRFLDGLDGPRIYEFLGMNKSNLDNNEMAEK